MPTLNFPTSPSLNQQYSFGGKTWYWTGSAWRLLNQGAINNIPIGNVTPSTGQFTSLTSTGNVTANGNINADHYFVGNGRFLTGIVVSGGASINNGNSSVAIPDFNGNIVFNVNSNPDVVVVTSSNVVPSANIVPSSGNTYNLGTATTPWRNVYAGNIIGNITGNVTISAANTEVVYSNAGAAVGSPNFTFDQATNQLSVAGNIVGNTFVGNGVGLTSTLVDSGSDPNNWDTLTKMGVYTVNRVSWSGTQGTPLDSQVYVGLLEVKNSTNQTVTQTFSPGTVDLSDIKIQWNRNRWAGSWTPWVKIVNDYQQISGGQF